MSTIRTNPFSSILKGKSVFVGIGNPLRGDDGIGPALIDRLKNKIPAPCINTETTPENYIGKITSTISDTIIFIDAMDMGSLPGSYCIVKAEELLESSISTHDIPLRFIVSLIQQHSKAECYILGIQPENRDLEFGLSLKAEETLQELESIICDVFK